jgi:ABC-2 type transport system permease protein
MLAGALRAEATLALANLAYIVMLAFGGVVFPLSSLPAGLRPVVTWLPLDALAGGLRAVLRHGAAVPGHDWVALAAWAAGGLAVAGATFRWE